MYLTQIAMEISTENLQFCYPKGFLSSSSTDSILSVARRTFSFTLVVNAPHSCQDYVLQLRRFTWYALRW